MFALKPRQFSILLGFVLATLLADAGMRALGLTLIEPYRNENRAERVWGYLSRPATEDVLLIGSSRVAGGFDARLLSAHVGRALERETSVYKLGIAGLRQVYLTELLRDGVRRRPPKQALVIALEPRFFCKATRRTRRPDPDAGPDAGPRLTPAPLPPAEDADGTGEEVAGEWEGEDLADAFWRRFDGLAALWNWPWTRGAELAELLDFLHETGGEHQTVEERQAEDDRAARNRQGRRDLFDLPSHMMWQWPEEDGDELAAFRQMLDLLDELTCEVIFVRMPLTPGFDADHMPVVSRRFLQEIVPAIEERGHAFHDLQGPPWPVDESHYFSRTHLTRSGCVLTTTLFADEILLPALRDG